MYLGNPFEDGGGIKLLNSYSVQLINDSLIAASLDF